MKGLEEATGAGKRGVVNENGLAVASPCSSRQLELMEKVPDRPRQAVILAGGRGVRLRPITDARPKPMIEFHGKPFLQYLVEMLRDQEFERIVLLLGYLPDVIIDHFGDGRGLGVNITYSVTRPDDLTGRRVRHAAPLLDDRFLLMYCDNYWPMQFNEMWRQYSESGRPVQVTVYANADCVSRSNVRVAADGAVEVFDRSRVTPGLQGVEIGFAIVNKAVALELLPKRQLLLEDAVYPPLVERRALHAFVTDRRYYSVGDQDRLAATEDYLATVNA
jgi:D-glycero-D-manno-heptose 1,7-bisphosphate phosphatase